MDGDVPRDPEERLERLAALVDAVIGAATAERWAPWSDVIVLAPPIEDADGGIAHRGLLVDRDGDRVSVGEIRRLTEPARRLLGLRPAAGSRRLPAKRWEYDSGLWVQRGHWREHLDADPDWCARPLPSDPAPLVDAVRALYRRAGTTEPDAA